MTAIDTRTATVGSYLAVRSLTEELAGPLSAEDQTVQSMPDCSPTKWHRAHTSWFFETFVLGRAQGYREHDPAYAYLYNSYYDAVGDRHPRGERGLLTRPTCDEVAAYRRHVDAAMADTLSAGCDAVTAALVELGLHHEQQHQELLLSDAKHLLSRNPIRPAYLDATTGGARPERRPTWVSGPAGIVTIGHGGDGFAFDNEAPAHEVVLRPYALRSTLVTCGEWLEFVHDGGYERPDLWLSDGWYAARAGGWRAPLHWFDTDGVWQVFTLGGVRPLDPAEPVCHVSYYEADAFARWAGARLPTEAEWEAVAREHWPAVGSVGVSSATAAHPVRPGDGDAQFAGQVWQWTASAYLPYPGFAPAPGAVGEYNGKFMVNQHVLRGSSCATPAGHERVTYRNFYPPSARWCFSGVRLASDG